VFVTVMSHFDRLLKAMVSRSKPSAKRAKDNQTSDKAGVADCSDTRTREGKSASDGLGRPLQGDPDSTL
jgi:hypothetical protein